MHQCPQCLPDGGRLSIETGNRRLDEGAAREQGLLPGQYVSPCVGDNGTGITPEVVARTSAWCMGQGYGRTVPSPV